MMNVNSGRIKKGRKREGRGGRRRRKGERYRESREHCSVALDFQIRDYGDRRREPSRGFYSARL
jgi:hypothetical protein